MEEACHQKSDRQINWQMILTRTSKQPGAKKKVTVTWVSRRTKLKTQGKKLKTQVKNLKTQGKNSKLKEKTQFFGIFKNCGW